jgi:hypothetical protein
MEGERNVKNNDLSETNKTEQTVKDLLRIDLST